MPAATIRENNGRVVCDKKVGPQTNSLTLGKQALYVNHGFTNRFDGMTRTESKPLLDDLVEVGSRADFTVRHSWAVGDIVMWDNRCVMHYAIHDYDDMPRVMHRVTVCGERPA